MIKGDRMAEYCYVSLGFLMEEARQHPHGEKGTAMEQLSRRRDQALL